VDVAAFVDGPELDFAPGAPPYIRIDASGSLHVGEAVPSMPNDCLWYQLVSQR
jgi:hypothetical protein